MDKKQLATVVQISTIGPHPNADRLEIVTCLVIPPDYRYIQLVTGRHYREGQLGVWIRPGAWIPGYLACDLWLSKKGEEWFEVREINMRGIPSPGLFAGEYYLPDREDPKSVERAKTQPEANEEGWLRWRYWQKHWKLGDDVAAYLGVLDPWQ